jgi:DNA-binding transcriptional MerR regulator
MRVPGRISPAKAAQLLGVHVRTIRSWCQKAVAGEPSHLKDVRQHITGYYWLSLAEVKQLMRHNPTRSK